MRILTAGNMYPPHSHGGYEVLWRSWVRATRAAGHAVRVLTSDYALAGAGAGGDDDVHRVLRWYWRDHEFPAMSPLAALGLERHDKRVLESHLAAFAPDVVVWWAMGGMPMSLLEQAARRRLPAVAVVADDWLAYGPEQDRWLTRCRRRPRLFAAVAALAGLPAGVDFDRAARWTFISRHTRDVALRARLSPAATTAVAPAGVPPSAFAPHARGEWSGRLLYAGRLDERKGVHTALEALALLPPPAAIELVGGGAEDSYLRRLESLARSPRLAGRVRFCGQLAREAVRDAYARADALVFCVLWPEPWGLVPLEAMACGTPVIATGTGGSGEYLEHERNCLLVEPGDPGAIAAAVRRLESDPGLRDALRTGGLATARRHSEDSFHAAIMRQVEAAIGS